MTTGNLSIRIPLDSDESLWNSLVSHPLQSWAWGEFRKSMGITVVRLLVLENEKPTDAWQVSFHRVPKLPYTIGYFPKGPTPDDFMIEELGKIGRKNNAIFIQIEPNVLSDFKFQLKISNYYYLLIIHYLRNTHSFSISQNQKKNF